VIDPHLVWIVPTVIFAVVFGAAGLYFARRRDLGTSILPQSEFARSRFSLLGSPVRLAIRQSLGSFAWWLVGTLAFTGLLAAMAKIATDLLQSSPAAAQVFSRLGESHSDLVIVFLSFDGMFTALILLVMAAIYLGGIRRDEAKGYLDTMLVQPVRRRAWLAGRLLLIVAMTVIVSLLAGYVTWQFTTAQGISLDIWTVLANMLALTGIVVLTLGIGAFLYGFAPRTAAIAMYVVIVWAFLVDVLKALFSLNDTIEKTSLFHYISFALDKAPDWTTFYRLITVGVVLAIIGIWLFGRRDVVSE